MKGIVLTILLIKKTKHVDGKQMCGVVWLVISLLFLPAPSYARAALPNATIPTATFVDSGQRLGSATSTEVALGDLNGDGALDAAVANRTNAASAIWLNDGAGTFRALGQSLPIHSGGYSGGVALGDADGNGGLDVIFVGGDANYLMLNDGAGNFAITQNFPAPEQRLTDAVLDDLDGDGDLDLVLAHARANQVWLNNGGGVFVDSQQPLGDSWTNKIQLGDVDDDGDPDLVTANGSTGAQFSKVWLNNGEALFSEGDDIFFGWAHDLAVADFDGDDDLDIFFASYTAANELWLNSGDATFVKSEQRFESQNNLAATATDADGDGDVDLFVGSAQQDASRLYLNNGEGLLAPDDQVLGVDTSIVTILSLAAGDLDGDGDVDLFPALYGPNQIWLNDETPALDPGTISTLRAVRDDLLPQTSVGRYYAALYQAHLTELTAISLANPSLLLDSWSALEMWTPALRSLVNPEASGKEQIITAEMVGALAGVVEQFRVAANPDLQATIAREQNALALDEFIGRSAASAWATLNERIIGEQFLPVVLSPR